MKLVLILIIGLLATVSAQGGPPPPELTADHDGQPGCATRYEFRRLWRNNLVPEQFWECRQWQEPAQVRYCPMATRFQDSWQTCVPNGQWQWTPYYDPPTRPGNFTADECEEVVLAPNECQPTEPVSTTTAVPMTTTTGLPGTGSTPNFDTTTTTVLITTEWTPTTTTEAHLENRECIGSGSNQNWPGWVNCDLPPSASSCTVSSINRRIPTRDPYVYYQCTFQQGWVQMRCTDDNCFDAARNACVLPQAWRQVCRD